MNTLAKSNTKIRKDTFYKITKAALLNENVSRSDIARTAGVSSMTAGKAVDILLKMGVLRSSRAEYSKGRHAELLSPSCDIRYVVLYVTPDHCKATVSDPYGNVIYTQTKKISHSLTLKDNIEIMLGYVREEIDLGEHSAVGAVLHSSVCERSDLSQIDGMDLCVWQNKALRARIENAYTVKNVLYLKVSDTISGIYCSRGNAVESNVKIDSGSSEEQILERLDGICRGISSFFVPDVIIAETDDAVLRETLEKWGREMPENVLVFDGMEFTASSVTDLLADVYAKKLSDQF